MAARKEEDSLIGHLRELRNRVLYVVFALGIGFVLCWFYKENIFDLIRGPIEPYLEKSGSGGLIYTGVTDKFFSYVKVAFFAAIVVTCPVWIFQIWRFIAPGLYQNEKKWGGVFVISGIILFIAGLLFVYHVVYPTAFHFLFNFGSEKDKAFISIREYLKFFTLTSVVFGAAFELPLALSILGAMGVITPQWLRKNRGYALVLLTTLCAFITPPDALSLLLLMTPLWLLYELSIFSVWWIQLGPKKSSRAKAKSGS